MRITMDYKAKLLMLKLGLDDFAVVIFSGLMSFSFLSIAHNPQIKRGPNSEVYALIAEYEIVFLIVSVGLCLGLYKLLKAIGRKYSNTA